MTPESWFKIITINAPIGFFLFFSLVLDKRMYKRYTDSVNTEREISFWIYRVFSYSILALALIALFVWVYSFITPKQFLVCGDVVYVKQDQDFSIQGEAGFVRRGQNSIGIRFVGDKEMASGEKITFYVVKSRQPEIVDAFSFVFDSSYYNERLRFEYDQNKDEMSLHVRGCDAKKLERHRIVPDESRSTSVDSQSKPLTFFGVNEAHAAQYLSLQDYAEALNSSDPTVFLEARKSLAGNGLLGLDIIKSILFDQNSSYKQKLGVLVALKDGNINLDSLGSDLVANVIINACDPDTSISKTSRSILRKYVSRTVTDQVESMLLQEVDKSKLGKNNHIECLALTLSDLLYNLGIKEVLTAQNVMGPESESLLQKTYADFQKAWYVNKFASFENKIYFIKALYGWALALNAQGIMTAKNKPEDMNYDPVVAKFKEFLQEYDNSPSKDSYPSAYAHHIDNARRYIKKPDPRMFQ